jgi:hypothetical protein
MTDKTEFHGIPTKVNENKFLKLESLVNAPRIVSLSFLGSQNIFADLGNESQSTPYGDFYLRGGHRLWHSPESMPRTYMPDVPGVTLSDLPAGVRIDQPAEPWTHIAKSIEIHVNPDKPQVIVRHELRNEGAWPVEFAPWALTMFRLGGVGIFPQAVGNADPFGLLANRQISIWPYAKINDHRLVLRDDFILVKAELMPKTDPALSPIKFGYFNSHGWMAYWIDGILFVKRFDPLPGESFPDGGCNTESYCNHKFIELESLGPLKSLAPEGTFTHTETWELYDSLDQPFLPESIWTVIRS